MITLLKKTIFFGMFSLLCGAVGAWFALFRVYPRYDIPAVAQIRGEQFEVAEAELASTVLVEREQLRSGR